jgi:hypothetical protein
LFDENMSLANTRLLSKKGWPLIPPVRVAIPVEVVAVCLIPRPHFPSSDNLGVGAEFVCFSPDISLLLLPLQVKQQAPLVLV